MGVDPQQHRAVTGVFASRLSSSSWTPSSRGRAGGAPGGEEGREEGREGWEEEEREGWREEVARQRREFMGRFLGWSVHGLLWIILLHQLHSMLLSLWWQHGNNQPFGSITQPSETSFDASLRMEHEHVDMDVLKAFLQVILIL